MSREISHSRSASHENGDVMAHKPDWMQALEGVLFRSWLISMGFLLLTFFIHQLFAKQIHELHGAMFGITGHEIDLIIYCLMGLLKLAVLVLFFIPWLAIRFGGKQG